MEPKFYTTSSLLIENMNILLSCNIITLIAKVITVTKWKLQFYYGINNSSNHLPYK